MDLKYIRADERVDGLDKELGSQIDPALEGGAESNSISSDSKAELKIENLEGIKDKKVEPKRSWANVVDDNVNSGQVQFWNDKESSFSEAEIEIEPFDALLDRKGEKNKKKLRNSGDENEIINDLVELELKEEK
ncbi:hypothetical protein V6N12_065495 [Hibiscus sabdariffa]|uniref:Uncharacterized protein n=1 Tax=Hibiscus sabdariffa TaxID=183260 RepID=A0ABR2G9B7_9ROSI